VESRISYTLVGLFVIGLGAALFAAFVWLATHGEEKSYAQYQVRTQESVSGLRRSALVRYRGVEVGRVASVAIDPDDPERVRILLDIEVGTPVRADTRAVLVTQGLTGLTSVELTGGSRGAPALLPEPGGQPPEIPSGPSLVARLDNALDILVATVEQISNRVGRLLSDQNIASLTETLNGFAGVAKEVADRRGEVGRAIEGGAATMENAARLSAQLAGALERVGGSIGALEETARSVTRTSRALEAAVTEGKEGVARMSGQLGPEVSGLIAELRQVAEHLRRLSRELETNPRLFLFGRQPARAGPGE
jgi:phospholipid/cholesterol/gamma-HCH transport system substrate-binding protein